MNRRKQILKRIVDKHEEARKTENKYRAIKAMITHMYPEISDITADIIYDIINADRDWRKLTEGYDQENKEVLSQKWQLENGYEASYPYVRNK